MKKLKGIIPAMPTPLNYDDSVDEGSLRKIVRHNIDSGVHGILGLGSMSSFEFLEEREKIKVAEIIFDEVNKKIPIIIGVSDISIKKILNQIKNIEHLDIDYYCVREPQYSYFKKNEIIDFYKKIQEISEKPVLVYTRPWFTRNAVCKTNMMDLDAKIEISKYVGGFKDTDFDIVDNAYLCELFKDSNLCYLVGSETRILTLLELGADGIVGGLQSLAPLIGVNIWNGFKNKNYEEAVKNQIKLIKLSKITKYGYRSGLEIAFREKGLCNKLMPSYFKEITSDKEIDEIKKIVEKYS